MISLASTITPPLMQRMFPAPPKMLLCSLILVLVSQVRFLLILFFSFYRTNLIEILRVRNLCLYSNQVKETEFPSVQRYLSRLKKLATVINIYEFIQSHKPNNCWAKLSICGFYFIGCIRLAFNISKGNSWSCPLCKIQVQGPCHVHNRKR